MLYKVGVIGPSPSIERILEVAKEFKDALEFFPFPYTDTHETEQIVWEHDHQVDAWLFSGRIPYTIAKKTLGSDENLVYIPHTGASLYKCFLNFAYHQGKLLERVSIDTVSSLDASEAFDELGLPTGDFYVKEYQGYVDSEELIQFHLDLWKNGKTKGAFTCFHATYLSLQKEGVPVYWITPTRLVIRQTLHLLAAKATSSYFKDTQIGILIIEVEQFDKVMENVQTPYHVQYMELHLKEILIKLCQELDGSLTERGSGRYIIYSTRGAIENTIQMLRDAVQQIALAVNTNVAVGIGFGETVFSAEQNGRRAVQRSKEKDDQGIVVAQEEGQITESWGEEEENTYSNRTLDSQVLLKLQQSTVGAKTYNKIQVLVRRMGWNGFTAKDLAAHLHMTERNSRRILAVLYECNLVQIIGEEYHTSRGRPSKIYNLA